MLVFVVVAVCGDTRQTVVEPASFASIRASRATNCFPSNPRQLSSAASLAHTSTISIVLALLESLHFCTAKNFSYFCRSTLRARARLYQRVPMRGCATASCNSMRESRYLLRERTEIIFKYFPVTDRLYC